MTRISTNGVFGLVTMRPLRGFPEGRIKLRFRNDDFAVAFVRNKYGIRRFVLGEEDGYFIPLVETGRNITREEGYPNTVCSSCGAKFGNNPRPSFTTWYFGLCDICGCWDSVTQPRDFGHLRENWREEFLRQKQ